MLGNRLVDDKIFENTGTIKNVNKNRKKDFDALFDKLVIRVAKLHSILAESINQEKLLQLTSDTEQSKHIA